MKKTVFFLVLMALVTLNLKALNLKKNLENDEAQNAVMENVEEQLNVIFEAMRPSNLLKVSWVGQNGKIGADAEPMVSMEGNNGILSFGVQMEVDTDKYAKEVYEPLKALLDKYAKCLNDNLVIEPTADKNFKTCLLAIKGQQILRAALLRNGYAFPDDYKTLYTLNNDDTLLVDGLVNGVNGKTKFFQQKQGFFMLQAPTKNGMKCHVYSTEDNPKFNSAICNALRLYMVKYGNAKLSVRAEDEDGILLGQAGEVELNIAGNNLPEYGNISSSINYFLEVREYNFSKETIPAFVSSLIKLNGSELRCSGNIYVRQKLVEGYVTVPKSDFENVKEISFEFKDNGTKIRKANEYINKLFDYFGKLLKDKAKANGENLDEYEKVLKEVEFAFKRARLAEFVNGRYFNEEGGEKIWYEGMVKYYEERYK